MDVASLAALLHETAKHHDAYEKASPPHDWWDWYAAYMDARMSGSNPEEADAPPTPIARHSSQPSTRAVGSVNAIWSRCEQLIGRHRADPSRPTPPAVRTCP